MNAARLFFRLGAGIAVALSSLAIAAPLTPGNVIVYRIGSGTGALSANGNAAFLDEYTPGSVIPPVPPALVQSIPLPTVGSGAQKALVGSGTATTDGLITRSGDGSCLIVPGYGRDLPVVPGTGNLVSGTFNGLPIPRVVGRITAMGAIDTSTALTDTAIGGNARGATSNDCASAWVSGSGTGGGVRYAAIGASTSTDLTGTLNNARGVAVVNGQLYAAYTVVAMKGVVTIGTGLPTNSAPVTKLPGLTDANSPGTNTFFLADLNPAVPGVDTLYVADETAGILKFSLVGATWVANGSVGAGADAYRGITGVVDATTGAVTLFAVRKSNSVLTPGGELVRLLDSSGHNGALAGALTLMATGGTNMVFRGVAMAPFLIVTPSAGAHGSISPSASLTVGAGTTRTFTVTPEAGYAAVVTGSCGGALSGTTFTTDPITASCTVAASFTQIPTYTFTPVAGPNGFIAPNTPRTVLQGTVVSFTVTPAAGYAPHVTDNCSGSFDGTTWTSPPAAADCTVNATFTLITHQVSSSAGPNGTINPAGTQSIPRGTTTAFTVTPDHGFGAAASGCGGTLSGTTFTTGPILGDCAVSATFTPLPRYTVSASAGANGTIGSATQTVISGDTTALAVTPAPGYHAAVRGTCGGHWDGGNTWVTPPVTGDCSLVVAFAKRIVLFVGNSYTFGRVDPVMSYNTANVTDLTHAMWLANSNGSNDDEPHPWGGIPGVFKKMTDQAGLEYDVSISARNAASLRGHYLNSNPAQWDLRGNMASQRWDAVVLQDLSDEPLPFTRGANANLPYFNAYVDKIVAWIHGGATETYTEADLYGGGSVAECMAVTHTITTTQCSAVREITPANFNATPGTEIYLYQTWARPDMIAPNGRNANGTFYTAAEGLETMTSDFHASYFGRAAANGNVEDVSPVGDAFLRAVQEGVAMRDPYVPEAGKVNLWHTDFFHPSKYGSYLSAAVHFATLTGLNPLSLGTNEQAAIDLGIAPEVGVQLRRVAQLVVAPDTTAPVSSAAASPAANGGGWNSGNVSIVFTASDEARGSGLDAIVWTTTGAQAGSGTLASGGTLILSSEGVTTVTWFARDRAGNAETPKTLTISIDKSAPVISGMPGADCSLWPPNKQMVTVATISASSGAAPIASLNVAAASSEPGTGDIAITASGASRTVALRADRDAKGPGRIYTITAVAIDQAGNSTTATATCTVPHDKG